MAWKPVYITATQLAKVVRASVATDQEDLDDACASASRAVDTAAGRQFGKTDAPETRLYRARWSESNGLWYVETDDFPAVTGWAVAFDSAADGTYSRSIDVAKLMTEPANALQKGEPFQGFYLRPAVSAGVDGRPQGFRVSLNTWGWTAVPRIAVNATKLQASRYFARRDAPFGVAGSPDNGSETRLLAKADPDVVVMLRSHGLARRAWAR